MRNGQARTLAAALLLVFAVVAAAVPSTSARAAAPRRGLWIGAKGDVQLSFTVRVERGRRTVADVTTFCGDQGSVEDDDGRPVAFAIGRDGTIRGWAGRGERVPRLRAESGVLDARTYTSGSPGVDCPVEHFDRIRVTRGEFRPIQDGVYEGDGGIAYDFGFRIAGGGTLATDLSGYAGVPDSSSLSGYCGPAGAIGNAARIGPDGAFSFDPGPGRDSRLVVSGTAGGTGASGSYTYTAATRCVGSDPLSGTVAWAATLTEPAPGSAPPGAGTEEPRPLPEPPDDAPDPVPDPGDGYDGPPDPSRQPGCRATVSTGPLVAIAACFRTSGSRSVSSGRVRLNGIDLTPAGSGVQIAIDRRSRAVSSTGPVELRIGSLSLVRSALDWRRPDAVFEIEGSTKPKGRRPRFRTSGQALFGLPLKGSAKLRLEGGRTKLTVTLAIPKDKPPLSRLSGYSGELTAAADNERGLILDGAKLSFPGMRFGFVEIQSARVGISDVGGTYHFDGGATVFPFRLSRIGFSGELGFGLGDGYFKLGAAVEQLNRALVYGFFLQKIGFEVRANPFGIGGSAGVTFGPQFRLGGELISAARLDGSILYLAGRDGEPSSVRLAGALELAEAKAADGSVEVRGDGGVTAEGTFALKVGGYGLDGGLDGWFDGARAFNVEGNAKLSLPGPDGIGDAVLSSAGVGACRHGVGPDVGFGYHWGKGVSGLTFAADSCSLGTWRVERAEASGAAGAAAATGPLSVVVPRGPRQLALQVAGEGAAPAVAVVAPDGRRIEPTAAPGGEFVDDTTLLVQDPDTRATYLVVDAPRPGRWRVEPLPGSAPVARLRTAEPLPALRVRGRVRASGRGRVLTYRARALAGRRLQLVELAGGARKTLRTVTRARGRVRFAPLPAGGRHRVVAVVLGSSGLPTGERQRVASYRAGGSRPPAPQRVRVLRRGSARTVTWRGARGLRYEVDVRTSDGRRLRLLPRPRRHAVTVGIVPRDVRVRATVRARDAAGRASRPVTVRSRRR